MLPNQNFVDNIGEDIKPLWAKSKPKIYTLGFSKIRFRHQHKAGLRTRRSSRVPNSDNQQPSWPFKRVAEIAGDIGI